MHDVHQRSGEIYHGYEWNTLLDVLERLTCNVCVIFKFFYCEKSSDYFKHHHKYSAHNAHLCCSYLVASEEWEHAGDDCRVMRGGIVHALGCVCKWVCVRVMPLVMSLSPLRLFRMGGKRMFAVRWSWRKWWLHSGGTLSITVYSFGCARSQINTKKFGWMN